MTLKIWVIVAVGILLLAAGGAIGYFIREPKVAIDQEKDTETGTSTTKVSVAS